MSMVEYMYKLLYGRRLTAVDAPTQSCSLPGDVLRWRLSRALQQCASIDSGSSPNVVSRRCSESTIVAPRLQCAAAASSPTSGANVTPGALVTPHSIGDSSNLFTDLLMTASCHDPSLGHVTWPDADAQDHQPSDVKPSCRYSRCSSPLMLTDKVDGNADCASMYQLPLTGLLTAEEYQTADVPFSPSAAYYLSAENSAYLPSYACQSTSSTGDEFDAGATTSPPFQPRSFPPSSAVKYDDDRMTCCCDRSEDGPGANAECPCAEGRSPWQQVNEYYSLTAGYSFTCSRSVVYDARFSARWQHRKERQRHCHSNRSSSSAAAASNATYLVQDSIASGASSADSTGVESRCHSAHLQPPLATSSSGGMRTSRKSVAGMPTVCASLTGNSGLQCAVCGDNAACQHYGVRTCEGCKGFFKRTVQKNSKYVCLSGRNCIIDKRRRNRCQYCRFQKCLAVGMVKEVVRRDTLKGRRGRLPSKPKTCQSRMSSSSASAAAAQHVSQLRPPQSPPVSLITALVRAFVDSTPDLPSLDYSQCYEIDLSQCSNATPKRTRQLCYSLVERSSEVIVQWAESVPGFIDLGSEDRKILIRGALIELLTLRLAYRFSPGDSSMTFCDGTVLHITQCKSGFGDNWFESVSDLSRSFHRQPGAIDLSVVSCLAALVLFTDRCSLRDPHRVELLQEAVLDTLRSHCAYRCGALSCSSRPGAGRLMVARALNGLVELRPVARQSATVLRQLLSVECATNDYHTSVLKDSLSELHEI